MDLLLQVKDTDWLIEFKNKNKQGHNISCLKRIHLTGKDAHRLIVKGWE
jgi:hypothetical protein